ncbi:N-formylglutamate amidohydrolase [Methyloligella halotolerans]|uniref:N-formylglutamate amidohydrolase n=1 Tax=Methyloligella halotolerans TaxID=1177755 RepID=A0A1E2RZI3_9HYPH|nr:DUF1244 domain-containing protein [Methyloligella halotolerans]ODA67508.1 N-formylglutamate amidohydrolase [Methyloligella halotolerans]
MEQRVPKPHPTESQDESYQFIDGDLSRGLIILCDHAENTIPERFAQLGLEDEILRRHIAYDPGAKGVATRLAELLGAPALLTRFSRLLIDPNRGPRDPTQIMQISDSVIVPGNIGLTPEQRAERQDTFYRPYHEAIDALIDQGTEAGRVPALLAIHSFTPAWKGVPRPWHATVLWDKDGRLPQPLLAGLTAEEDIVSGENVPYSGELEGDTLNRHGTRRGVAHALIELRQDLLGTDQQQEEWAERLARIVRSVMENPAVAESLGQRIYTGGAKDRIEGQPAPGKTGGSGGVETEEARASGSDGQTGIGEALRTELEAATFRRLRDHLRERTDVQNIDMMDLAGFCRNCLSRWYMEAAAAEGVGLSKDEAREIVYGIAYEEWKTKYQK